MALNVNRSVQDSFYRYKMPRLVAKVEGKGNGVKTVLPNMSDVAKALGRPPTYCTKYFGCELGAQTQFDFKNDRYIVNGAHDAGKLQDMLDGFIRKYVLCEKCDNPETVLRVYVKKGIINSSCKACGHSFTLDMRHKLTTYIVRNPPEQSLAAQGTSLTGKKDKRSVRREQQEKVKDGDNDEDDWDNDEGADKEWITDVSEEAVKQRMMELTSGVKGLAMDADIEKPESERINIFHAFLKRKKEECDLPFNQADEKEIHQEAERLEVTNKATIVLCEVILDGDKITPQLEKSKRLFLRFTNENQKAQKYLIGGIEKTIESRKDHLLPRVPVIFKAFYDLDVLEEEVIIDWAKKVSKKYVSKELAEQIHQKAKPFVTWLKEAEVESEDDGSDIELEFNDRAKISTIKQVEIVKEAATPNGKANVKEEEQKNGEEVDDFDIDDI